MKELTDNIKKKYVCDQLIWYLTVMLIIIMGLFDGHHLKMILMYGITGCVGCLILFKECNKFRPMIKVYHIIIVTFIVVCFLSTKWSWDSYSSYIASGYILRICVCVFIFYYHYEKQESIEPLFSAIKWGGYILAYCCLIGYNPKNIIEILVKGGRVYNEFYCHIGGENFIPGLFHGIFSPNINLLGTQIAFATVIGMFELIYRKRNIVFEVLSLLPVLLLVAVSGGKMNFLITLLGLVMILMLKTKKSSLKKTAKSWGLILVIMLVILFVLSLTTIFRETFDRFLFFFEGFFQNSKNVPMDSRVKMIQIGFEQFKRTPIAGIGVDNSNLLLLKEIGLDTYLHCNYIELLVGLGLIGTIVFYFGYLYTLIRLWMLRKYRDEYTSLCIILIVVCLIIDIATVTYTLTLTYIYLAMFFIHVEHLKLRRKDKSIQNV